ncbi:hypothetical protein B0H17DRAFT_1136551 [Mycena rosella]|uniref:Uncharacterized protein n=1 Tax=Mycena rosella TaxID=1033263 RepID=A0AAD7DB39_MYCRO|nr:hypothetical protein B0H17DRAFT_1136551 [Mycena rosella]
MDANILTSMTGTERKEYPRSSPRITPASSRTRAVPPKSHLPAPAPTPEPGLDTGAARWALRATHAATATATAADAWRVAFPAVDLPARTRHGGRGRVRLASGRPSAEVACGPRSTGRRTAELRALRRVSRRSATGNADARPAKTARYRRAARGLTGNVSVEREQYTGGEMARDGQEGGCKRKYDAPGGPGLHIAHPTPPPSHPPRCRRRRSCGSHSAAARTPRHDSGVVAARGGVATTSGGACPSGVGGESRGPCRAGCRDFRSPRQSLVRRTPEFVGRPPCGEVDATGQHVHGSVPRWTSLTRKRTCGRCWEEGWDAQRRNAQRKAEARSINITYERGRRVSTVQPWRGSGDAGRTAGGDLVPALIILIDWSKRPRPDSWWADHAVTRVGDVVLVAVLHADEARDPCR